MSATPADLHKIQVLKEIFKSRNDNDPRLDSDFNQLSEDAKGLLRDEYRTLAMERRNEKGTIVYLLGNNLTNEADFKFLCEVLREPPCLSLGNCQEAGSGSQSEMSRESGEEITLAYPQIMGLKVLERFLAKEGAKEGAKAELAASAVNCGKESKVAAVYQRASQLSSGLNHRD